MKNKKKNCLDVYVSQYLGYTTPLSHITMGWKTNHFGDVLLNDFLHMDFSESVARIRAAETKGERDRLKKLSMCVTVSGTFPEESRRSEHLIKHSGLICLDIDQGGNPDIKDWERVKEKLSSYKNIAYISLSASGNGIFVILPIRYPERHGEQFDALVKFFGGLGIRVDKSCRDVSRLRGYSYDPNPYVNPYAIPYEQYIIRNRPVPKWSYDKKHTEALVVEMIDWLIEDNIDITHDRKDWIKICYAFNAEFGEKGRKYFQRVSSLYPTYDPKECDRKYTDCQNVRELGIGTFSMICDNHGYALEHSNRKNILHEAYKPVKLIKND